MCWQKTDFVDFCLTQWWSRLGFAGIPRISLSQDWRTQAQKSVGTNHVLTLHDGASSRIGSRLFSQINRLIHPILHLSFIIKQTRNWTFEKTFQLVRVAQITTERQEKQKWELGVQTTSTRKKSYLLSIQFQSKSGMVEPWNRREGGQSISLMKAPMERVSRSPQEVQKPHSHSQLSLWCPRRSSSAHSFHYHSRQRWTYQRFFTIPWFCLFQLPLLHPALCFFNRSLPQVSCAS